MKIFVEQLRPQGAGLTAYLHDKSPELSTASVRPAILIFPGGGYYSCSDREAEPIALAYLAEGYNSFVCRYSVGTQTLFADAFEDAQTAMALLHSKCEEWDIDKNRIAAVGFSAGGHLASAIGTMGNIRPAALILGYPVILENMGQLLGKEIPCTNECVDDTTPPTFIFATRDDDTVPIANTLAFTGALEKVGVGFELHIFGSGKHGLSLAKPHVANGLRSMHNPTVKQWFDISITWLKAQWGDYPTGYEPAKLDMEATSFGIDTPLYILLAHDGCREALERVLPELIIIAKGNEMIQQASIQVMATTAPEVFTENLLERIKTILREQSN